MTPEILIGPPGTGKTTALLDILDEELERGTAPELIGFVSFTRKAADEAAERAMTRFGLARTQLPYFRTLHSLAFRALGLRSAEVFQGQRVQQFAAYASTRINGRVSEDGTLTGFDVGDRALFMENLARIREVPLRVLYDEDDDNLPWREIDRIARALAAFKREHSLVDYTDMLAEYVALGRAPGLEVLLVDETQDLSLLQHRMVGVLGSTCRRVVFAGDDDQAIYRWAGADVGSLIRMEGSARVLGQSYRVPPVVQAAAGGIISRVSERREKVWAARTGAEGRVDHSARPEDVEISQTGTVLVLARNEYVLREQVEPWLQRAGFVYERRGHSSVPHGVWTAVTDWETARKGAPLSAERWVGVLEHMSAGRGVRRGSKKLPGYEPDAELTAEQLSAAGHLLTSAPWFEALDRLPAEDTSYLRAALARGEKPAARPRIRISTIHGAKGGEADHVVLSREIAARTWADMDRLPEDEMRVWYVAVTRARERLTVVDSTTQRGCPWL